MKTFKVVDNEMVVDEDEPETVDEVFEAHAQELRTQGYTVVPDLLTPDKCDEIAADLRRLEIELDKRGSDSVFEGHQTVRIYHLLRHGVLYQQLAQDPRVLPLLRSVLGADFIISNASSIAIGPGEVPQMLHTDDQLLPLPKPHVPIVCNTMWAITPFTEQNGATRLVPGTHTSLDPEFGRVYDSIAAEMPRGSALVWDGSLWHGGGPNRTDTVRRGISFNYCAGWIRQHESPLGLPLDEVATFSPTLQDLVGYGTFRGLVGHIDGRRPVDALLTAGR